MAHEYVPHTQTPIWTFTIGPGISSGQPVDGFDRVAGFHRRLGISPNPACV
jgi:hypothetical protein